MKLLLVLACVRTIVLQIEFLILLLVDNSVLPGYYLSHTSTKQENELILENHYSYQRTRNLRIQHSYIFPYILVFSIPPRPMGTSGVPIFI